MRNGQTYLMGAAGLLLGVAGTLLFGAPVINHPNPVHASTGGNDRYQDYIMCTGAVAVNPRAPTDGVWMLDYRSGRLLGTVIDRTVGKIAGWAEVDLVTEFGVQPKQDVHFMMTTGTIAQGQAALYVAEVTSGKFGVYTMGPAPDGNGGIIIRRHDLTTFRANKNPNP
ncbi:MAG: hypothetical protein K8T89_03145 [Planctomycetes bacterium]|nr:hypothetical protein [Planctomycetota bacterium]